MRASRATAPLLEEQLLNRLTAEHDGNIEAALKLNADCRDTMTIGAA